MSATGSFGDYLRMLRERQGLTLDRVAYLSSALDEPLNKGYVSRCERGQRSLGIAKLIPISDIYKVPAQAIVERLALDRAVGRLDDLPEVKGSSGELLARGGQAIARASYWEAYAVLRTAQGVGSSRCEARDENNLPATFLCGWVAARLGRTTLALHELRHVLDCVGPNHALYPEACGRVASIMSLDNSEMALQYAMNGARVAIRQGAPLGGAVSIHFVATALAREHPEQALEVLRAEDAAIRENRRPRDDHVAGRLKTQALQVMSLCYKRLNRPMAAVRAAEASLKNATELDFTFARVRSQILLGELAYRRHDLRRADMLLGDTSEEAQHLQNSTLQFIADYYRFRIAQDRGRLREPSTVARALTRLLSECPRALPEVRKFLLVDPELRRTD